MIKKLSYFFKKRFLKKRRSTRSTSAAKKKSRKKKKPATKKKSPSPLTRGENPIIAPNPENDWEAWQTFNAGAVLLDGKVHFLYRAIGEDGLSRLGYAVSSDGFTIDKRLSIPVYEHTVNPSVDAMGQFVFNPHSFASGGSFGGVEDPRLVRIKGENAVHMTYTACAGDLRVGLTSIHIEDFLNGKWNWEKPALISPPGETHKNWLIFPEKIHGKYAIIHSIKPTIQIEYVDTLEFDDATYIKSSYGGEPQTGCWDKWVRSAGAPPVKTPEGWLLFYHAMDDDWGKYKVGAMLLDLDDPTKILYRAKEPVLEPCEHYENNGYKGGVVYVSGAIIKEDTLLVYYGAADSFVCLAYSSVKEFLDSLKKDEKPKLKLKTLLKKK